MSSDKKGILYDGKTGEKIGELSSEDGHKGTIYAVSWSPDGKEVSLLLALKLLKTNFLLYSENLSLKVPKLSTSETCNHKHMKIYEC